MRGIGNLCNRVTSLSIVKEYLRVRPDAQELVARRRELDFLNELAVGLDCLIELERYACPDRQQKNNLGVS